MGWKGRETGWGKGMWWGEGERNNPNIVCTYELKKFKKRLPNVQFQVYHILKKAKLWR
jgi:hypothetical protein